MVGRAFRGVEPSNKAPAKSSSATVSDRRVPMLCATPWYISTDRRWNKRELVISVLEKEALAALDARRLRTGSAEGSQPTHVSAARGINTSLEPSLCSAHARFLRSIARCAATPELCYEEVRRDVWEGCAVVTSNSVSSWGCQPVMQKSPGLWRPEANSAPTSTRTLFEPKPMAAMDARRSRMALCSWMRSEPFGQDNAWSPKTSKMF